MTDEMHKADRDTSSGWLANRLRSETAILSSPTAKMDFLREQLAAQGKVSDGMSWKLLLLEWRYDQLILLGGLTRWMRNLDRRFNHFPERH